MKFTKLSMIAILAMSAAYAGGDIEEVVEPVVETPAPVAKSDCKDGTTVDAKLTAYYYTDDSVDLFDSKSSGLAAALTVDLSHKFNDTFTANFSAVGYHNFIEDNFFEGQESGGYLNVANLTATFGDTTAVLGRQLLGTPMLQGYDWLLAPGSFEAYTLVNSSIENVTLIGAYVTKWRANNSNTFSASELPGDNWTVSASYDDKTLSGSVWYYNVDAMMYTQVYADLGYKFGSVKVGAQYSGTDWDGSDESTAFGIMASGEFSGVTLTGAYVNVSDEVVGYVGWNGLYTNSWNTTVANSVGNSYKVEAAGEVSGLSVTGSYAYYEYDMIGMEEGHEFDLILGYNVTDCVALGAVYANTDYGDGDDINQIELFATYKF